MTISLVQSAKGDGVATATYSAANTLGNLLVVIASDGDGNPSNPTVSDTALNRWQRITFENDLGGPVSTAVLCAVNCKAAAPGNVVTISSSPVGYGFPAVMIAEFRSTFGANALTIASGLSSGAGNTGNSTSGSCSLNVIDLGNILLVGGWIPDQGGEAAGSGFTLIQDCTTAATLMQYKLVSGPANYSVAATGSLGPWAIVGAAFKETPNDSIFYGINQ